MAISRHVTTTQDYYNPDLRKLWEISGEAKAANGIVAHSILASAKDSLPLEELAQLIKGLFGPEGNPVARAITRRSVELRRTLFGDMVVPMAPVEISNTCASDCVFCGWRLSNKAMKRLRMPMDLAMLQVEYLVDLGIHYIEFVSGDDFNIVRKGLPELIRETKALFKRKGVQGKIAFCTMALTEAQYCELHEAGADAMVVWQESYDPQVFQRHIVGGPKASGISDDWKPVAGGDGCRFRIESQERAMRAGLEVALGSMLGLNPDVCTEFLATVDHARFLAANYGASPVRPIIIGMPVWNAITTQETDLRPDVKAMHDLQGVFPAIAALYLLALPSEGTWVFPNCRVPMETQIEAARVAGAFSSTEVKLGPGGYLPSILRKMETEGQSTREIRGRINTMIREAAGTGEDIDGIEKALDEREQFVHHYHSHKIYDRAMADAGLTITRCVQLPSAAASAQGA